MSLPPDTDEANGRRIAILSAMPEENASLVQLMNEQATDSCMSTGTDDGTDKGGYSVDVIERGMRRYHCGTLWGHDVVVVFSHWGKVAAASTASFLINSLDVREIVFTGVAGALDPSLNVGDIVIGDELYQHDMDASPIIERHEIPLLGMKALPTCESRRPQLVSAAQRFAKDSFDHTISQAIREQFDLKDIAIRVGSIASGDQFISDIATLNDIRRRLPDTLCVEMEGAAVAQVCAEHQIPFSIVRTISDSADEAAAIDFPKFIESVAQLYSLAIVENLLAS